MSTAERQETLPWSQGRGLFRTLIRSGRWWVIPGLGPSSLDLAERLADMAGENNCQALILRGFGFQVQFVRKRAVPAAKVASELRRIGARKKHAELVQVLKSRDVLIGISGIDDFTMWTDWVSLMNAIDSTVNLFDDEEAA